MMPQRDILALVAESSPWREFLREFFDDTLSEPSLFFETQAAGAFLDQKKPELAFVDPSLMTLSFTQKLKVRRQTCGEFRVFSLSRTSSERKGFSFDGDFGEPRGFLDFQKKLCDQLALPETIRVLVTDDDQEIGWMIRDFLSGRTGPRFEVDYEPGGDQALEAMAKRRPDVLILDIKMPGKDGKEVYADMIQKGYAVPTIIFFDAVAGDDLTQIRRLGRPAIVEKGTRLSTMPDMMQLIKKLVYFS